MTYEKKNIRAVIEDIKIAVRFIFQQCRENMYGMMSR